MKLSVVLKLSKQLKIFVWCAFIISLSISIAAFATPLKNGKSTLAKTVVVDAGHGGFDGGAISVYGMPEKNINLSVALKTEEFLKLFGFNVVMTRCDDNALDSVKKNDMYKRLEIVKANPDSVFVSIHQNNFSQSKYFGAQMFYGKCNADSSKVLALILQENFRLNINPENTRQAKPAPEDLFLFRNSPVPSVLVECGFLSNYTEAKLLINEQYQNRIAFTIAQSIVQFYAAENIERIN